MKCTHTHKHICKWVRYWQSVKLRHIIECLNILYSVPNISFGGVAEE